MNLGHRRGIALGTVLSVPLTLAVACTTASTSETAPAAKVAVTAPARADLTDPRTLHGTITIATQGLLKVPGAPLTLPQQAFRQLLAAYQKVQPGVTVKVTDLPPSTDPSDWCSAKKATHQLPDISLLTNCDYGRPTAQEVREGTSAAVDFTRFASEVSPYGGKPWKQDWANDNVRTARCRDSGAVDVWTCIPYSSLVKPIFVNWGILHEFGVKKLPTTISGLWQLSKKINDSGKYQAWDPGDPDHYFMFRNDVASLVAGDVFTKIGGDPANLNTVPLANLPHQADLYCTRKLWLQNNPGMQEAIRQTQRFIEANGGAETFFDPNRVDGQDWLLGKAAFWWGASDKQDQISQAQRDGSFRVKDWSLTWLPDLRRSDLIDKSRSISYHGKFYVYYGNGQGDAFAAKPEYRDGGRNSNVDVMVRDFLQFFTSPYGQQWMLARKLLPLNPQTLKKAPAMWRDALTKFLTVDSQEYQSVGNPPGTFMQTLRAFDPAKTEQAYYAGKMSFAQFMRRADTAVTDNTVEQLKDNLAQWGLTQLPASCRNRSS